MAAVKTLRGLLHELRRASPNKNIKDSLAAKYVIGQFKKHQTTDETLCKAREEIHFLGQTYLCYLHSRRNYEAIRADYTGKGELSIKDTADLVGFKLPHDRT